MTKPRPWTAEEDASLRDWCAAGKSLHSWAKENNRQPSSASLRGKKLGLDWGRPAAIQAAQSAAKIDAGARLADFARLAADKAARLIEEVHQPHTYWELAREPDGRESWLPREQPEPTPADKRNLVQAACAAAREAREQLERASLQAAASDVDLWLQSMTDGNIT